MDTIKQAMTSQNEAVCQKIDVDSNAVPLYNWKPTKIHSDQNMSLWINS